MSGEDTRTQSPHLMIHGRTLVLRIIACLRLLRGHGGDNEAFLSAVQKLTETANALLSPQTGRLRLEFYEDVLLLNGTILHFNAQGANRAQELSRVLEERGVGGFGITRPVDVETIRQWLIRFGQPVMEPGMVEAFWRDLARLQSYGIETFSPRGLSPQNQQFIYLSNLSLATQAYARAVIGFREFVFALERGRDPFQGKIRFARVVQDLVDITRRAPGKLFKVLQMRMEQEQRGLQSAADYASRHAAGTCAWALLMGAAVGLNRFQLLDLGSSAMLSKVGFALLPVSLTEKRGELTAEERRAVRMGTVRAVQQLIAKSRLNDIVMRRMIVAYEYQRPYCMRDGQRTNTHVYSRVVALSDAFDAMLSLRPWRAPMSCGAALDALYEQAGVRFDPNLVSLLAALVNGSAGARAG